METCPKLNFMETLPAPSYGDAKITGSVCPSPSLENYGGISGSQNPRQVCMHRGKCILCVIKKECLVIAVSKSISSSHAI